MSVKDFLDWTDEDGKIYLGYRKHHSISGGGEQGPGVSTSVHFSLLLDCRHNVASCFTVLMPCLSHRDGYITRYLTNPRSISSEWPQQKQLSLLLTVRACRTDQSRAVAVSYPRLRKENNQRERGQSWGWPLGKAAGCWTKALHLPQLWD